MFGKVEKIKRIISITRRAFGEFKYKILTLTLLGFLSGLLEAIGVNAFIPIFSLVTGEKTLGDDSISQYLEKFFSFIKIDFSLKQLLIFICLLFIIKAVVIIFTSYIRVRIANDYEEKSRKELFSETLNANFRYLSAQKLGYLETVLMTDIRYSSTLLQQISAMIMAVASLLVYVAVAINISAPITFFTILLGLLLFILFKPLISKTKIFSRKVSQLNKTIAHLINETIRGGKTIKSMYTIEPVIASASNYFRSLKNWNIRIALLNVTTNSLIQPITILFVSAVFVFSYKFTDFKFAAFLVVIYLVQRIFQYIQLLQNGLHKINENIPYLSEVIKYKDQALENREKKGGNQLYRFSNSLIFDKVCFSYEKGKDILSQLSFKIKKGELVGLVGQSGAGKTTVVDLLLRLYDPDSGTILLDGEDCRNINLSEWRKNIGYFSQNSFLINDSIANNIKFYDDNISTDDIIRAAKMADIYDFIQNSNNKFETIVGEDGLMLSGGQRQRIIIARILARKPQILLLDEATSALDSESDLKIQQVIESLKGQTTVLAIAHRLSTLLNFDRILVLEEGKIIEEGNPEYLLKMPDSSFYKMYNIGNNI